MNDPFAPTLESVDETFQNATPAETRKSVGEVTVDVKPNFKGFPVSEGKVVLTFKGGTGFDAPWVVIHAADLDDAYAQVTGENAQTLSKLMEQAQIAGQYFAGKGKSSAPAQQRQAAPPEAHQPPAWFPPPPAEGWVYKTGMKKNGSGAWHAWAPPQKGGGDWQFHNPPK